MPQGDELSQDFSDDPTDGWIKTIEGANEDPNTFILFLDREQTTPLLALRLVPPTHGQFWMGWGIESHPTQVEIRNHYWIAAFPTTQWQWRSAIELTGSTLKPNPSGFRGNHRPVETITWEECTQWLRALNDQPWIREQLDRLKAPIDAPTEDSARWQLGLPSEAHWEWACRAKPYDAIREPNRWTMSLTEFSSGDGPAALGECGWFDGNANRETHAVGSLKPNPLGLYDMHGNVWEWCLDTWLASYEALWHGLSDKEVLTLDESRRELRRAFRGGSWVDDPTGCRSAVRFGGLAGYSFVNQGFRAGLFFGPNDKQQGSTDASLDRAAQASSLAASKTTRQVVEFEDMQGPPRSGENFSNF
jgi:formylglycine-generating enzyme required for sulfatase activity